MLREIGKSLIAASPLTAALGEANRMARRYLQQGGAAIANGADRDQRHGFVVPSDIDSVSISSVIEAKLRSMRNRSRSTGGATQVVLERGKDGRLFVPAEIVQRLGKGDDQRGRQWLDGAVRDIRGQRALMRATRPIG
jgi:hypothetical protein